MTESEYQKKFLDNISILFKGCIILPLDPKYKQGIPDWIVLYKKKWAALEIKRTKHAHRQPNQAYYVERMNNMGYSSFVYPENEQKIIQELIKHFEGETI